MADFVEYANGPADSAWGRKRAADGHPEPYRLKHLELGNEEAVNEDYWREVPADRRGDLGQGPRHHPGRRRLRLRQGHRRPVPVRGRARPRTRWPRTGRSSNWPGEHGREVWFDIHVWTDHPPEPHGLRPERSYIEQLGKIAPGAKYKVVIFEYNSGNHAMKRALSNALATNEAERIGDLLPIACAANCLQPDGQNDNGWDQGLLFLNPSKVWLQPPGLPDRG